MGEHTKHDLYEAYPIINGQLHAEMLSPSHDMLHLCCMHRRSMNMMCT